MPLASDDIEARQRSCALRLISLPRRFTGCDEDADRPLGNDCQSPGHCVNGPRQPDAGHFMRPPSVIPRGATCYTQPVAYFQNTAQLDSCYCPGTD